MVLPIVRYGHPVLRQKGARVETLTEEIRQLAADMLETMKEAHGVGLAAQQVGHAMQLMVLDVRGIEDRPSTMEMDGKAVDVAAHMPMIMLNPELTPAGEAVAGPEGCLSFPQIYADIARPETVDVKAMNGKGEPLAFRCGGLLARAVQHETDHLNGVLFIDRMAHETRQRLKKELRELHERTKAELGK
jgi:peptide deformylase